MEIKGGQILWEYEFGVATITGVAKMLKVRRRMVAYYPRGGRGLARSFSSS